MAAPTGEKSILLHVCKANGRNGRRRTELWFIVKHTTNSIKVEEIFKDLPSHKRKFYFQSNCALIGSFLYVLGGQCDNSLFGTILGSRFSRRVRRLNIQNPTDGWESCRRLPCECGPATLAVAGNSVYLFPKLQKENTELQCGCFYDTTTQTGHAIEYPPDCSDCKPPRLSRQYPFHPANEGSLFCSAFEDGHSRGVVVPKYWKHLYLYNPDEKSWKNICNFRFPKPRSEAFPRYAVFNEKLYLSFCDWSLSGPNIYLHVYDIRTGQYLLDIKLPHFENLDPEIYVQFHLLAIADCKLCYLWLADRADGVMLCLVKVEVLINERSVNCSQMEVDFDLDVCTILNCIPFDSYPGENQEENTEVKEKPDDTGLQDDSCPDDNDEDNEKSNDTSLEETNSQWGPCGCHDGHVDEKLSLLEAETQRLHEGFECLQKEVQQLRALITSEDKILHKRKRGTKRRQFEANV